MFRRGVMLCSKKKNKLSCVLFCFFLRFERFQYVYSFCRKACSTRLKTWSIRPTRRRSSYVTFTNNRSSCWSKTSWRSSKHSWSKRSGCWTRSCRIGSRRSRKRPRSNCKNSPTSTYVENEKHAVRFFAPRRHNLEVRLVEEKHREEINLYEIQVSQLKHLIATQQSKLDHIQMKRNNIAQELKTVMEAQWNEALKIINNGRSPDTASTGIQPRFTDRSGFKQFFNTKELPEHETEPERPPLRPENDLQKYIKMVSPEGETSVFSIDNFKLLDKEPGSVGDDDDRSHPAKPAAADNNHNLSTYSKVSWRWTGRWLLLIVVFCVGFRCYRRRRR